MCKPADSLPRLSHQSNSEDGLGLGGTPPSMACLSSISASARHTKHSHDPKDLVIRSSAAQHVEGVWTSILRLATLHDSLHSGSAGADRD